MKVPLILQKSVGLNVRRDEWEAYPIGQRGQCLVAGTCIDYSGTLGVPLAHRTL